ncbi:MAG: acetyl-CoA carboxylase biotin carboxyl carrier protein [Flavobacteriales bacterium]|nr:acetyl-CoA carboxylase biotin carboxyl carrier protein [Flavobacteriales bacterium]MCW8913806.1 acetyl-CoA carboxylase biotin carboxyl carrier protein [Flavobacteriales bacterium]MCW8937922.1 acetyl-CoA carboxylase biotin carboxyl carrier protein [Flavobacteriales bacterium]MCW8939453.1 acetyl-CoA carboxylase biotin carboxyl carrier protein [Flavobacteriales bacterium]MCW8968293.1 acetyl-CoA carboxylase biotin carboxyl carrier protein [Flavobacteriales bacterium]
MKSSEIQELIKFVAKSGVSEVEIENKDFKITIKTPPYKRGNQPTVEVIRQEVVQPQQAQQAPVAAAPQAQPQATPAAPAAPAKEAPSEDANYVTIKSPMIGTFYRKPSPDKPNYVSVGDEVKNETVVCVIEAMKLFNEIEAEINGKIVKILVDDGSPVEYDQPLFLVDPS